MKLYKYSGTIEEFAVERGRICEACGTDEAIRDWGGNIEPLSDWVLVRVYNGDLRR